MEALRVALESVSLALGVVMIALTFVMAGRVHAMDEAALASHLFLRARGIQRTLVVFSVAIMVFVLMPVSILGYMLSNEGVLELAHDVSHLMFVLLMVIGLVWLIRLKPLGANRRRFR